MRGREQRNWIDLLLVGIASASAVYSGGQAVGSNIVSMFALALVAVGTVFSSLAAWRFRESRFLKIDGFLFLFFGLGAFFGARYLNLIFEEDTFPRELQPSAWLIWLLIFGSFVLWRDTTLLFQAIPALALFGFVGCYDTFRPVIFFFFLYLICVATLFARAHARDMAERAEKSGYFGADLAALKAGRGLTVALRTGPWRWVAGPEWALGSALAIVALSLLGAPAIRQGVKPISGIARVVGPRNFRPASSGPVTSGGQTAPLNETRIARGPVQLRNTPAFDIQGSQGMYFRTDSYDAYAGGTWTKQWIWTDEEGEEVVPRPLTRIRRQAARLDGWFRMPGGEIYRGNDRDRGRLIGKSLADRIALPMTITTRNDTVALPVPGDFVRFGDPAPGASIDRGQSVTLTRSSRYEDLKLYFSPALDPVLTARSGRRIEGQGDVRQNDPALVRTNTPGPVAEFARRAAGEGSDGLRAARLRAAIATRIVYNINAQAAPPGVDPVARALFETHEGYCDIFASAMVLGARELGIPARYAVGYVADPKDYSPDGTLTLLDSDAHAWAELYFEGRGWTTYDATAGARVAPNGGRRDGDDTVPWYRQKWVVPATNMMIGALVLLGSAFLFWPRRRDPRAALRRRDETLDRFVRGLARTIRRDRRLDESLVAYVAAIAPNLGEAAGPARELAIEFERGLYGPIEPDEASNAELARRVQSLRRLLRSVPRAK